MVSTRSNGACPQSTNKYTIYVTCIKTGPLNTYHHDFSFMFLRLRKKGKFTMKLEKFLSVVEKLCHRPNDWLIVHIQSSLLVALRSKQSGPTVTVGKPGKSER
jgi:short-subunit dehydrogenase